MNQPAKYQQAAEDCSSVKPHDLRHPDWDTVRDDLGLPYEASYEDVARRLLQRTATRSPAVPDPAQAGKLTIERVLAEIKARANLDAWSAHYRLALTQLAGWIESELQEPGAAGQQEKEAAAH